MGFVPCHRVRIPHGASRLRAAPAGRPPSYPLPEQRHGSHSATPARPPPARPPAMHHGDARAGGLFASRTALDATFVVISITAVPQASLLLAINNEARALRHVVGTNIATVAAVDGLGGWPQLLPALVACMESDSVAAMEGALDALYKVHTRHGHKSCFAGLRCGCTLHACACPMRTHAVNSS